jgi:hypothetical protein
VCFELEMLRVSQASEGNILHLLLVKTGFDVLVVVARGVSYEYHR